MCTSKVASNASKMCVMNEARQPYRKARAKRAQETSQQVPTKAVH